MAKKTIRVKDYLKVVDEKVAAGTITPGMLVELTSADKVQAHSTEAGVAEKMFAYEDEHQGNTISDDYSAADYVQLWLPQRGDVVYALLADGEDAGIGDFLVSDGAGKLRVVDTSAEENLIGVALEAVDMSGSSGEDPSGRILVRIV